jgi:hypothetical protein
VFTRPLAIAAVLALCACAGPTVFPDGLARDEAHEGDFRLVIESPRATWRSGEPIELAASLTYNGPQSELPLHGSGAGPIAFMVEEVDGTRKMEATWRLDCAPHPIRRGVPLAKVYAKSGGYTPDDPNVDFYRSFFDDPVFRLPPGRWRVTAIALFDPGETCTAHPIELTASVTLDIR